MGVVTLFRVLRACVLLLVAAVGHRRAGRTHLVAVLFTSWPKMRARVVLYLAQSRARLRRSQVPYRA